MKNELSALLDGESPPEEARATLDKLKRDGELRRDWGAYLIIGSALRAESHLDVDLAARVMNGVRKEPAILVPARRSPSAFQPLLALAASLSGIAVVAWFAFGPLSQAPSSPMLAAQQPIPLAPVPSPAEAAAKRGPSELSAAARRQIQPVELKAPPTREGGGDLAACRPISSCSSGSK